MIHSMQYELERARHVDDQLQAAQHRLVAEAEKLVSAEMPPVAFLCSVIGRVVMVTEFVRGGAA